ncbi:MAG: glutamate synthase-related protein [Anaerolineales bacterium]
MILPSIRSDVLKDAPYGAESDSCAIYISARKHGQSTFGTLKRSLSALVQMGHRTGFVNGEGDGAGVQTDIPRRLWTRKLSQASLRASLANQPGFWVGHFFVPSEIDNPDLHDHIFSAFDRADLKPIYQQPGRTRGEVLGANGQQDAPEFWQIAGYVETSDPAKRLLKVQLKLEDEFPIHFLSLSDQVVVYKIRGSVETLSRFFPDLQDRNYDTSVVLCHARYSTNTVSNFERSQPFAVLGHNGEINTIHRFRIEAEQIGVHLTKDGSDSQDIDRTVHSLCVDYDFDLIEAMETVFPPVPYELEQFPPELRNVYKRMRQAFGPYAQGPAAILARYADTIVASVDAIGLRPLWFVETEKEFVFSSERGAIPLEVMVRDPRPLGPGEKMAIKLRPGDNPEVLDHFKIRQHVMNRAFQREAPQLARQYWINWDKAPSDILLDKKGKPGTASEINLSDSTSMEETTPKSSEGETEEVEPEQIPWLQAEECVQLEPYALKACGWNKEHVQEIDDLVKKGKGVGSLGYDGPLAAISQRRTNLADYFKETVAVVTNPAIDRDREMEVFSTSSLFGACPSIGSAPEQGDRLITLKVPILTGGHPSLGKLEECQSLAEKFGSLSIEQLIEEFNGKTTWISLSVRPDEDVRGAVNRIGEEAAAHVRAGAQCLVLDDSELLSGKKDLGWLDPLLAVSQIDEQLRTTEQKSKHNMRRQVGVAVRSASIRTLHDIALLIGFGADAVCPYAMFTSAMSKISGAGIDEMTAQLRLFNELKIGLEKVISTIGCHELRGYGRLFSSIGISPSISDVLQTPNFLGSEDCGLNWKRLNQESINRKEELQKKDPKTKLEIVDHFFPKFWKKVVQFTHSKGSYDEALKNFSRLKEEIPVSIRHLIGFKDTQSTVDPESVSLAIDEYDLPFVIAAMSFGSQGQASFRAYAQTASKLNMMTINGEGGELPAIFGKYKKNRGQQIASGRFGVNAAFLNSAAVLEIKIGQGAKPGEGGMLPGAKVSPIVAEARHTPPYVPLLSPSNNHDLYSIEDLAQLIEELKAVNPEAKISVKVPVVPGIGVIAVGIAKAGADIINLSGYDAGTGAARKHALQYVGLPTEIGLSLVHRALLEAGLRHKVEIWCDGGMKTGEDAVKMVLLGANRVGFGTMAMVAIGCSTCRKCQEGNCHAGIATQIQTLEDAQEQGIKTFHAVETGTAVERLERFFTGIGNEIRGILAGLGAKNLQDLVGRGDLLEQVQRHEQIDLSPLFISIPVKGRPKLEPGVGRLLVRPRNNLTRLLSELIKETVVQDNEHEITYQDSVSAIDRALGSHIVGAFVRQPEITEGVEQVHLRFGPSSIGGNGFAAWMADTIDVIIEGGSQDGTAKGASGGCVAVMKGLNDVGSRIDGSVGKSFAYGAQKGILIVQGNADSRACIRLSGADVVIGGEITRTIDEVTFRAPTHANIKGFACEYMTSGRVLIMGDPGPYAFSGMTGGVVYQKLTPEFGFDKGALANRIALGAQVEISALESENVADIQELLGYYVNALEQTYQNENAEQIRTMITESAILRYFVKVIPQTLESKKALLAPARESVRR